MNFFNRLQRFNYTQGISFHLYSLPTHFPANQGTSTVLACNRHSKGISTPANIWPQLFRTTAPTPSLPFFLHIAPSKFILHYLELVDSNVVALKSKCGSQDWQKFC